MAEENTGLDEENTETEDEEGEEGEGGEKKGGAGLKKIIIFAGIGVVLLGLGIGGTMFFMGSKEMPAEENAEQMAEDEIMEESMDEAMMETVIYHDLHPAFVANFTGKSKKKYMQVYVVALTSEESVVEDLKLHDPAIRNNILMTLSQKTSDEVATVEGKEELRKEVLNTLRETMKEKTGKDGIKDLYFTKFVAQ